MTVYKSDYEAAKALLWPEETVEVTATQRQIGPGGSVITPTTIVATDKRVIIINRVTFGMRKDIESIPYNRITSVRFERGIISSSIFLRIEGFTEQTDALLKASKQWGEIDGLRHDDAKAMTDYINKMLSTSNAEAHPAHEERRPSAQKEEAAAAPVHPGAGGHVYCWKCGSRNTIDSRFCSSCGVQLTK